MAQETLKSLIAVIMTLSLQEQRQVISELQDNVRLHSSKIDEATRQQLIASAEAGIEEIQRGEFFTNDEVLAMMNQRVEQQYEMTV
jgi:predicted transcriptional regulator